MQRTAITVGGATVDTIAVLDDRAVERISLSNAHRSYLLLEEGHKADARAISNHAGGGAVNTAVAFSRLGWHARTLIKVGDDARAQVIKEDLLRERVALDLVRTSPGMATGASVLVSAHQRNAAIFTYRGANGSLVVDDLPMEPSGFGVDVVYIAGLSNASAALFPEIVRRARQAGAFVGANPGARQIESRSGELWAAMGALSLLSLNVEEADRMIPGLVARTTMPPESAVPLPPGPQDSKSDERHFLLAEGFTLGSLKIGLKDLMRAMLAQGLTTAVITDGQRGAYAAEGDVLAFCPAPKVDVAGTTGAGDAFSATFAACSADGLPLPLRLQYATTNAAAALGTVDAHSGLHDWHALECSCRARARDMQVDTWPL